MEGEIVWIQREDHGGDRIPMKYRDYIPESNVYKYKARIIHVYQNKPYNRVQPLPLTGDESTTAQKIFRRKGYKSKTQHCD